MDITLTKTLDIIIADDHELFTDGLETIISGVPGFAVIAKVNNGKLLIQTLNRLQPDIILLDISMPPYMDGMETAKIIKTKHTKIKIVLVSGNYSPAIKKILHEYNIDGFIIKAAGASAFKDALCRVAGGEKVFITTLSTTGALHASPENDVLKKYKLTKTEIQIIALSFTGLKNKEIADQRKRSIVTIEKQKSVIMRKLNLKNMTEVVGFAVKQGLV